MTAAASTTARRVEAVATAEVVAAAAATAAAAIIDTLENDRTKRRRFSAQHQPGICRSVSTPVTGVVTGPEQRATVRSGYGRREHLYGRTDEDDAQTTVVCRVTHSLRWATTTTNVVVRYYRTSAPLQSYKTSACDERLDVTHGTSTTECDIENERRKTHDDDIHTR